MKFRQTHAEGGDCTAPYDVTDYPEIVADFIGEVLQYKGEWGNIIIDVFRYEYKYGELVTPIPSEILMKKIVEVKAAGGWSLMDYHITTSQPGIIVFIP